MPAYRVVITGHLDRAKSPENIPLPTKVHQIYNYDVEREGKLTVLIEQHIANITGSGAMQVYTDPSRIDVGKLNQSIMIPLHMFTHFTWSVRLLQGESPYIDTDGKTFMKSGKDVVKN